MRTEILPLAVLFLFSFLLTVVAARLLLPILRRRKAGQPILEIGPAWHMTKAGTPTLGGLSFIVAILTVFLVWAIALRQSEVLPVLLVLLFATLSGLIGFYDDCKKLAKRQNEGLTAAQKYLLQLFVSALFLVSARALGVVDTAILLPFYQGEIELGLFYYPLALLYLTGVENALNLTDGLDGLLSSTVAVTAAFFLLFGAANGEGALCVLGALLLGGAIGFLFFNHHPAKVFMGDTGSLFLGGVIAGAGLIVARPVTVLLAGGVYTVEAASVILQVLYFKMTDGKRLFLMAPLHHHFEKRGLSENAIVGIFSLAALFFSVLGFIGG